jgi:hypothetical protein
MFDTPAARNSDPMTSHLAADHITATGARAAQQQLATKAVEQYPGFTSLEIAKRSTLCRFMLARRLPECEHALTVRRGQARRCSESGRMAVTWWPAGTVEQQTLFPKERVA